jgi:hypothetical protein
MLNEFSNQSFGGRSNIICWLFWWRTDFTPSKTNRRTKGHWHCQRRNFTTLDKHLQEIGIWNRRTKGRSWCMEKTNCSLD